MRAICLAMLIAGLSPGLAAQTAQAGRPYHNTDLPGLVASYAQPLSSRFSAHGEPVTLGNNGKGSVFDDRSFVARSADRLDVSVKFPGTTPYLGLGYGLQSSSGSSFRFELGSSIGRPSASEPRPALSPGSVPQAEFDKDPAQPRDGVGRTGIVPQVSLGMQLRF